MDGNKTEKKTKQNRDAENPQWRKEIGLRISKAREECDLSQNELADRLGVNRVTLTYWENGIRDIKTTDIVRLADALDVSCDYLLRGVSSENLSISEEIGLSEKAINALKSLKSLKEAALSLDDNAFGYERVFEGTFEIDAINILLEHCGDSFFTHNLCDLCDLKMPHKNDISDVVEALVDLDTCFMRRFPYFRVLSELELFMYSKEQLLKEIAKFIEAIYIDPKIKSMNESEAIDIDDETKARLHSLSKEYELTLSKKYDVLSATQGLINFRKTLKLLEEGADLDSLEEINYADNNETE